MMTCVKILIILTLPILSYCAAPFIPLDTVHQAYSEFEINLILNQNRNHPIILTTVGNKMSKEAATSILESTHQMQKLSGFSILIQCSKFQWNLNHTLNICEGYYELLSKNGKVQQQIGTDSYFSCQIFIPSQLKIKQKGHTIMKNHNVQPIPDGKHFTSQYLSEVIKKNIPDFVYYIEDEYELTEFLQEKSDFKVSKQPKLLYFDQNLLAPIFLRKLSALMNGKIEVAVTDDPPLANRYACQFDSLIFLQYSFNKSKYEHRKIPFNDIQQNPEQTILRDDRIQKYLKVRKNRDILLDFQHSNFTVYQFDTVAQIEYLQTQGRLIVVQISEDNSYSCQQIYKVAHKFVTLFNYVCYDRSKSTDLDSTNNKHVGQFYIIINSLTNATWVKQQANILDLLPKATSRQKVSTSTQAQQCLRTSNISQRYPIFYYFSQRNNSESSTIINYLNSLPEVTSLLYFCQIIVPDQELTQRFTLRINTMFTLYDPNKSGYMKKLQHTKISEFIDIKMFIRQIAIQKMLKVYEDRLVNNQIQKISTNQQLTDKCFDRKCIVALLATGRYREQQEIKIMKQLKLQYQELFRFVWMDGICHWEVPKQLKILKKKQKVIDRSYVFFYNEKDISYNLWESKKFWDKKQLQKWIKSLRNTRKITHLKFGIDLQNKICKKKGEAPVLPEQL